MFNLRIDISQDSLDFSSTDDISAAIEKYEKFLSSDMKSSNSFHKENLESSSNSCDVDDRRGKEKEEKNTRECNKEQSDSLNDSTEDSSTISKLLSNSNLSLTQFLDTEGEIKISPSERLAQQREAIIERIKKM